MLIWPAETSIVIESFENPWDKRSEIRLIVSETLPGDQTWTWKVQSYLQHTEVCSSLYSLELLHLHNHAASCIELQIKYMEPGSDLLLSFYLDHR